MCLSALVLLLEAEAEFSHCRSELVERIDNTAILSLDIAWCYLMLQSVGYLYARTWAIIKYECAQVLYCRIVVSWEFIKILKWKHLQYKHFTN